MSNSPPNDESEYYEQMAGSNEPPPDDDGYAQHLDHLTGSMEQEPSDSIVRQSRQLVPIRFGRPIDPALRFSDRLPDWVRDIEQKTGAKINEPHFKPSDFPYFELIVPGRRSFKLFYHEESDNLLAATSVYPSQMRLFTGALGMSMSKTPRPKDGKTGGRPSAPQPLDPLDRNEVVGRFFKDPDQFWQRDRYGNSKTTSVSDDPKSYFYSAGYIPLKGNREIRNTLQQASAGASVFPSTFVQQYWSDNSEDAVERYNLIDVFAPDKEAMLNKLEETTGRKFLPRHNIVYDAGKYLRATSHLIATPDGQGGQSNKTMNSFKDSRRQIRGASPLGPMDNPGFRFAEERSYGGIGKGPVRSGVSMKYRLTEDTFLYSEGTALAREGVYAVGDTKSQFIDSGFSEDELTQRGFVVGSVFTRDAAPVGIDIGNAPAATILSVKTIGEPGKQKTIIEYRNVIDFAHNTEMKSNPHFKNMTTPGGSSPLLQEIDGFTPDLSSPMSIQKASRIGELALDSWFFNRKPDELERDYNAAYRRLNNGADPLGGRMMYDDKGRPSQFRVDELYTHVATSAAAQWMVGIGKTAHASFNFNTEILRQAAKKSDPEKFRARFGLDPEGDWRDKDIVRVDNYAYTHYDIEFPTTPLSTTKSGRVSFNSLDLNVINERNPDAYQELLHRRKAGESTSVADYHFTRAFGRHGKLNPLEVNPLDIRARREQLLDSGMLELDASKEVFREYGGDRYLKIGRLTLPPGKVIAGMFDPKPEEFGRPRLGNMVMRDLIDADTPVYEAIESFAYAEIQKRRERALQMKMKGFTGALAALPELPAHISIADPEMMELLIGQMRGYKKKDQEALLARFYESGIAGQFRFQVTDSKTIGGQVLMISPALAKSRFGVDYEPPPGTATQSQLAVGLANRDLDGDLGGIVPLMTNIDEMTLAKQAQEALYLGRGQENPKYIDKGLSENALHKLIDNPGLAGKHTKASAAGEARLSMLSAGAMGQSHMPFIEGLIGYAQRMTGSSGDFSLSGAAVYQRAMDNEMSQSPATAWLQKAFTDLKYAGLRYKDEKGHINDETIWHERYAEDKFQPSYARGDNVKLALDMFSHVGAMEMDEKSEYLGDTGASRYIAKGLLPINKAGDEAAIRDLQKVLSDIYGDGKRNPSQLSAAELTRIVSTINNREYKQVDKDRFAELYAAHNLVGAKEKRVGRGDYKTAFKPLDSGETSIQYDFMNPILNSILRMTVGFAGEKEDISLLPSYFYGATLKNSLREVYKNDSKQVFWAQIMKAAEQIFRRETHVPFIAETVIGVQLERNLRKGQTLNGLEKLYPIDGAIAALNPSLPRSRISFISTRCPFKGRHSLLL